ncbi:MAG: exonuclease SbcCD subunit D [Firmicutes bacterium]|nr:exonuclease SbcCD subunit D [Bacillota bacterium]
MRILHTSDWHLGKTLEGRSRFKEQEDFIEELCGIVEEERVELVLIAGDVFDTVNPSAAAEQLYYDAFDRLSAGGKRAVVVIAGNHDSPERLRACAPLANRYGIFIAGFPRDDHLLSTGMKLHGSSRNTSVSLLDGGEGWLKIGVPGAEHPAVVLTLPYPSEARLQEALAPSLEDEALLRQCYSDRVASLFRLSLGRYQQQYRKVEKGVVILGVSHLFVRGGWESDSERPIHLGGALAVAPEALPPGAQYIALGHLHRPQTVANAPTTVFYSGSPLAYSFSEAGQAKVVALIELQPGEKAEVRQLHLSSGRPLVRWRAVGGIEEVKRWIAAGRDADAWIDLEIHVDDALPVRECGVLRELHEGIVNIRPVLPEMGEEVGIEERSRLPLDRLFCEFYSRQTGGGRPDDELVKLFLELVGEEP